MKHLLQFCFSLLLVCCFNLLASAQFPVPEMAIKLDFLESQDPSKKESTVKPFTISELITVGEFNEYLAAVKKDSSAQFYKAQIPGSMHMSKELVGAILKDKTLQNEPVPGVSWTVARNYCTWLNAKTQNNGIVFELPKLTELLAFEKLYPYEMDEVLESWALDSYDESFFFIEKDHNYFAKKSDPPAMKRKIIYGGSYHMDFVKGNGYRTFHYEYQDSSSRFIGFRIVQKPVAESGSEVVSLNNGSINFTVRNNHLNGVYSEKYADGTFKVAGEFYDGQRIGVWSVWNSEGRLEIQRYYSDNRDCQFLYPNIENPYEETYARYPAHVYKRNKDGFYRNYLHVEERSVVWSSRLWRQLTSENEPELFKSFDPESLAKALFDHGTTWFLYGMKGDFKTVIKGDSVTKLKQEAVAWDWSRMEVKEDFFFNSDNLLSESRQIALSFYKNETDERPSYTVYYPKVREYLAKIKVDMQSKPEINNLDDVFFFNAYRGKIVYKSNVFDRSLEEMDQSDWPAEIEKYQAEHDLWISYGR